MTILVLCCEILDELSLLSSPYTIGPVTLRVGPKKKEFYIPKCLLDSTEWSFSHVSCLDRWTVTLPDIDESTGHVLVHYLYTGVYQTLDDADISPKNQLKIGFHRAFLAYAAAISYNLPGLQQLAMQKMQNLGTEMTIFDIIKTVDKDFSKLSGDSYQVSEYMLQKASSTFDQNLDKLEMDALLEHVSNVDLTKLLLKCMVSLYHKEILETSKTTAEPIQMIPEQPVNDIEDSFVTVAPDTPTPEVAVAEAEQPTASLTVRNTHQIQNQINWWNYAPWKSMHVKDTHPAVAIDEDCGICKTCVKKAKKKKKREEKRKTEIAQEGTLPSKTEEGKSATTVEDTNTVSPLRSESGL